MPTRWLDPVLMHDTEPPKDGSKFLAYTKGIGYDILYWHHIQEEFVRREDDKEYHFAIHNWIGLQ